MIYDFPSLRGTQRAGNLLFGNGAPYRAIEIVPYRMSGARPQPPSVNARSKVKKESTYDLSSSPLYAQVDSPRSNVLYFLGGNKQVACFQIIKTIRLKAGLSCKNRNNNEE